MTELATSEIASARATGESGEAGAARRGAAGRPARALVQPLSVGLLFLLVPVLLPDTFVLPGGYEFGFKSFTRNVAVCLALAVVLRADGMRWPGSTLLAPLLVWLGVAALSVWASHGVWGEVRLLLTATLLFVGARALAAGPLGARGLWHWLGAFGVGTVLLEVARNPGVLALREAARNDLLAMHPNTLGCLFALLGPIFLAATRDRSARRFALLYLAAAIFGEMLTFSRSGWLALAAGMLVVVLGGRRRKWRGWVSTSAVGIALAVAIAAVVISMGRQEADWQRLRIFRASLSLFLEHPLLGIGFGVKNLEGLFPARYLEYYGVSLFLFHSHNVIVDTLTGMGVLGAAALALLVYRLVRLVAGAYRATAGRGLERAQASGLVGSAVALAVIAMTDMPFYQAKIVFVLGILWAYFETEARRLAGTARASAAP